MNKNRILTVGVIAAALLVSTACAAETSEQAASATTSPVASSVATTEAPAATTAPSTAPTDTEVLATVDPSVPEEFVGYVGPVAVQGAKLPPLEPDAETDPAIGMTAPTLVGIDYANNPITIDPSANERTLVVFLAHWCPHCNDEIPILNEWGNSGRKPVDLQIYGVSTAINPQRPNFPPGDWLYDKSFSYPTLADGIDMSNETYIALDAYGVTGFPFAVLLDSDGTVVDRWAGSKSMDQFDAAVNAATSST